MRNIKFRGKTKETGEWVDGSYVYVHKWFGSGKAGYFIYDIYGDERVLIDENTLGQFTGLYDKNGKEIYENDMVEYDGEKYEVSYDCNYCIFCLKNLSGVGISILDCEDKSLLEVIGNIYETNLEEKDEKHKI